MRFIVGFIAALVLMGIAIIIYIYSGQFDVAASNPHGALERWAFNTTMRRSVITAASAVGEPPTFTDHMAQHGLQHYDDMCTGCHGGPGVERSEIGKGLNPQAPDLSEAVKMWTPRQLFWIVKNGVKMTGMPSFGTTHDDEEIWNIVTFIKKLPGMSAEQYEQTKQRGAAEGHEHGH
jgi:mono/diheme cytochrome c family protein